MAPKKTGAAAPKKAGSSERGTYQEMIKNAIIQLKERSGSSRQALKKYVLANNNLKDVSDASFTSHFNNALAKGSKTGLFEQPKGPSGTVKLGKSGAAKAAPKAKPEAAKKTAAPKKESVAKKAAAPKKEKAAAPKKEKANTSKARKAAPGDAKPKKAAASKVEKPKKKTTNAAKPKKSVAAASQAKAKAAKA